MSRLPGAVPHHPAGRWAADGEYEPWIQGGVQRRRSFDSSSLACSWTVTITEVHIGIVARATLQHKQHPQST